MLNSPATKYKPFPPLVMRDRQWPNRPLTRAPRWCSVELRDGNQALAVPMNMSQKLELFHTLVRCGFKEIEVGFPSASNTEFKFNRPAACPGTNGKYSAHNHTASNVSSNGNGNGNGQDRTWCPIHQCSMRKWEKDGRVWYSHKAGDAWCNGKAKRK